MEEKFTELKNRLLEVDNISSASAVLNWDQATYMPPAGAAARGRQMATLGRISHEKFTDVSMGRLLDDLMPWAEGLDYDSDEASLVRVTRRNYDQAVKIPTDLLGAFYEHTAVSYQKWTEARPNNDFTAVQDDLAKTIDYSRQVADCFAGSRVLPRRWEQDPSHRGENHRRHQHRPPVASGGRALPRGSLLPFEHSRTSPAAASGTS